MAYSSKPIHSKIIKIEQVREKINLKNFLMNSNKLQVAIY